jgi:TonB family protein
MDDAVSDALHARTHGPEGLIKMLLVSVAAHIVLMMLAALAPASFWLRPIDARSATVTIDLGPSTGPDTTGLTSIGARPVQRVVSDKSTARPTDPPAAKTPESTLPAAGTDVQSESMGLSMAASGGTGGQLNVADFCCPDYIGAMIQRVRQNWNSSRGGGALTTMRFTIERDGAITHVQLLRSSGNQMLDFLAERALLAVRQLPPLPDAYTNPSLVIDLEFQYQR